MPIINSQDFFICLTRMGFLDGVGLNMKGNDGKPRTIFVTQGGPIAVGRDGDKMTIDIPGRKREIKFSTRR